MASSNGSLRSPVARPVRPGGERTAQAARQQRQRGNALVQRLLEELLSASAEGNADADGNGACSAAQSAEDPSIPQRSQGKSSRKKNEFKCWQCGSLEHPSWRCEDSATAASSPPEQSGVKSHEASGNGSSRGALSGSPGSSSASQSSELKDDARLAGTGSSELDRHERFSCSCCQDAEQWGRCEAITAVNDSLRLILKDSCRGSSRKGRNKNGKSLAGSSGNYRPTGGRGRGQQAVPARLPKAAPRAVATLERMRQLVVDRLCKKGHRPRLETYMLLLEASAGQGLLREAEAVLVAMQGQGVRPDAVCYNTLLNAWCEAGCMDDALGLVLRMLEGGCPPSASTYNTLLKGLGLAGRAAEATQLLRGMLRLASSSSASSDGQQQAQAFAVPVPSTRSFNVVVLAWCDEGHVEEARGVMRMMRNSSVSPDAVTYNTLLKAYAAQGRVDDCWRVLREMANAYIKPTERTFGILMQALCDAGRMADAGRVVRRMQHEYGVAPNATMFNTLIKGYASRQMEEQAEAVLREMQQVGVEPDVVSYSTLMNMWSSCSMPERSRALLGEMQQRGLSPDVETYSVLAKGYLRARDGEAGEAVLAEMQEQGLQPNVVTYTTVVSTWCSMGGPANMERALQLLDRMDVEGVTPNIFTLRTVLWGLSEARMPRRAEQLLLAAERRFGVVPDARCWDQVAIAWQSAGLKAEAQRLRLLQYTGKETGRANETLEPNPFAAFAGANAVEQAADEMLDRSINGRGPGSEGAANGSALSSGELAMRAPVEADALLPVLGVNGRPNGSATSGAGKQQEVGAADRLVEAGAVEPDAETPSDGSRLDNAVSADVHEKRGSKKVNGTSVKPGSPRTDVLEEVNALAQGRLAVLGAAGENVNGELLRALNEAAGYGVPRAAGYAASGLQLLGAGEASSSKGDKLGLGRIRPNGKGNVVILCSGDEDSDGEEAASDETISAETAVREMPVSMLGININGRPGSPPPQQQEQGQRRKKGAVSPQSASTNGHAPNGMASKVRVESGPAASGRRSGPPSRSMAARSQCRNWSPSQAILYPGSAPQPWLFLGPDVRASFWGSPLGFERGSARRDKNGQGYPRACLSVEPSSVPQAVKSSRRKLLRVRHTAGAPAHRPVSTEGCLSRCSTKLALPGL